MLKISVIVSDKVGIFAYIFGNQHQHLQHYPEREKEKERERKREREREGGREGGREGERDKVPNLG